MYNNDKNKSKRGFTIVELLVSLAIFVVMTALLIAKYGNFNQSILLTNLAYDTALTIRNAQSYGLNVKSAPTNGSNYSSDFDSPFGVHFDSSSGNNKKVVFFVDKSKDFVYDQATGEAYITYEIKNGNYISSICASAYTNGNSCDPKAFVDISFRRPNPSPYISSLLSSSGTTVNSNFKYAKITLKSTSGETRNVIIIKSGQISISG